MTKGNLNIEDIRKAVTPVAEKYGVKRVFLFGSYARGDNTDKSDIDLRIDKGKLRTLWQLSGFRLDVQDNVGRKVDVVTTLSLDVEFLCEITKEELLIYSDNCSIVSALETIIHHCDKLKKYIKSNSFDKLIETEGHQDYIAECVSYITMSVSGLSVSFKEKHPSMPWRKIEDMFGVFVCNRGNQEHLEMCWNTMQEEIPALRKYCQQVLKQLQQDAD